MAAGFLWQPKHFAVADDVAVAADVNAAAVNRLVNSALEIVLEP